LNDPQPVTLDRDDRRDRAAPAAPSTEARGVVGQSIPRAHAKRLVAGRGRYVDDVPFGRLLHAAFLRSPYAHARIARLDLAPALAVDGVVAAFDARALAAVCKPWETRLATWPAHRSAPQLPLALERVLWQGQPVAIVLATNRARAEDAVAAIEVEWEELEPVVDARAAIAPGAAPIHASLGTNVALDHRIDVGGADARFADAHRVVSRRYRFARQTGVPLEARTLVADFDPTVRRLTVHQSTQVPHQMRAVFAEVFDLPEHDVRVVTPDVGGGYGIKLHVYDDEVATCAASILLGRPVKYLCDRLEAFTSDVHARAHDVEASVAFGADGAILGMRLDTVMEAGAHSVYPRSSVLEGLHVVNFAGVCYAIDAYQARLRVAYQNKVGTASYRGVGQPVACSVTEWLMDAGARALGLDPTELRRRNFRSAARGGVKTPAGIDAGGLSHAACMDRLLQFIEYPKLRAAQAAARREGRHLGIGFATFVEQNAPGPGFYGAAEVKISGQDGCTLRLEPSGTVTCITSNADQGQGVETAIQQLVGETLGLAPACIRIAAGDTMMTSVGGGTFASRGLSLAGEAALRAAHALRDRLLGLVAALWKIDAATLSIAEGVVREHAGERSITIAELATLMNYKHHLLPAGVDADPVATAHFTMPKPFHLANGVQASLVEVDVETGFVKPLRHWVVEDCGRVVNPLLADEQIRGGIVQGLGPALLEECRYDERGQLLTSTMADYLVPMALDVPDILIDHVETPVPDTLLGGKGVGEAGTVGAAAALGNAINDALAPFGAEVTEQPFTPERILRALKKVP
jgi:carbon-monoxide dehydrogenase large subunit